MSREVWRVACFIKDTEFTCIVAVFQEETEVLKWFKDHGFDPRRVDTHGEDEEEDEEASLCYTVISTEHEAHEKGLFTKPPREDKSEPGYDHSPASFMIMAEHKKLETLYLYRYA